MPLWIPASSSYKPVKTVAVIPVHFKYSEADNKEKLSSINYQLDSTIIMSVKELLFQNNKQEDIDNILQNIIAKGQAEPKQLKRKRR